MGVHAVVLDIEGTTTPISFVGEVMFPYVARELENYLRTTWEDEKTKHDVKLLLDLSLEDKEKGVPGLVEIKGLYIPHRIELKINEGN